MLKVTSYNCCINFWEISYHDDVKGVTKEKLKRKNSAGISRLHNKVHTEDGVSWLHRNM